MANGKEVDPELVISALLSVESLRSLEAATHLSRVADLAERIARKMNLSEIVIRSVRMAGLVHDIGKIKIPVAVLNKTSKLTEEEYAEVKTHVVAGHFILKDLDFPYPLAQMVLQHHERLDGSGYPFGLQIDEILLESKILAVADVVDAMSCYRPYRAALNKEQIMKELTKCRGVLYDSAVVDAILSLL